MAMTSSKPEPPSWTCDVCGDLRPDRFISVAKGDASEAYGLPGGTLTINTKFCNDRTECEVLARSVRLPGDLKVVHFDWDESAKVRELCSRGPKTNLLSQVTCNVCQQKMLEVVRGWMKDVKRVSPDES